MKLSISTVICAKMKLEECLSLLKESGFNTVEISREHLDISQAYSLIDKRGIKVWSVHGISGYKLLSNKKPERDREISKEIIRMKEASHFAPCPYVIHYLLRFDHQSEEIWKDSISKLLDAAKKMNLILAMETMPHHPGKGETYSSSDKIVEFVESFRDNSFKICVDINHSNVNEDLTEVIRKTREHLATIHVSDNHGITEEHLRPGKGIIDFKAIIRALKEVDYKGPFNLEVYPDSVVNVPYLRELRKDMENLIKEGSSK
ncbi:MAG: sugar phosphate isomerase/epimerase [bacterium]